MLSSLSRRWKKVGYDQSKTLKILFIIAAKLNAEIDADKILYLIDLVVNELDRWWLTIVGAAAKA